MKGSKLVASLLVASSVAGMAGCASKNVETNADITPEKNADGNYNILFVTTDQEHYFQEYPEGTEYEARKLLEELGTTFEKHYELIKRLSDRRWVYGVGVSLVEVTEDFLHKIKTIDNAVVHVINGIFTEEDEDLLALNGLKILILGYKHLRRGESYYEQNDEIVNALQEDLDKYLFPEIINNGWFKVVSFDNLAIKQLNVQKHLPEEQWEEFYMGDDGNYTFYIDMVEGTFAKNSLAEMRYPIMDSIDEMFQKILSKGKV